MGEAEVSATGEVSKDERVLGRLNGFRFTPEAIVDAERPAINAEELAPAIEKELEARANRLSEAVDASLVIASDGAIRWLGEPVAKIAAGDSLLSPRALLLADSALAGAALEKAQARVDLWLSAYVRRVLAPLFELQVAAGLEGAAAEIAHMLADSLGVLERGRVARSVKSLDQNARGALRKLGVRFGAYYIYVPALVKPAIRALSTQLWALRRADATAAAPIDEIPLLAASGRTSFVADAAIPREIYRVAGFRLCGDRAVRVDIVERLADLIRPAATHRPTGEGAPPPGSVEGGGFTVTGAMTSLAGCSGEQFASVLRSLGYESRRVKRPPPAPALAPVADAAPVEGGAEAPADATVAGDGDEVAKEAEAAEPSTIADAAPVEAPATPADAATAGEGAEIASQVEASASPPTESDDLVEAPAAPAAEPVPSSPEGAEPAAVAAAPVAEEETIEVWFPRPHVRPENRRGEAARSRPHRPATVEGEGAGEPRARGPRGRHQPRAERAAGAGGENRRGRGPRRKDAPAPEAAVGAASEQAKAPERADQRGGRGRGREREQEREKREAPPPRPPREAPVNLNSPFAKLLALKSQLEARGKRD